MIQLLFCVKPPASHLVSFSMKQFIPLLFFLIALGTEAQVIRYDTIRVAAGDERNIHQTTKQNNIAEAARIQVDEKQPDPNDLTRFDRRNYVSVPTWGYRSAETTHDWVSVPRWDIS